MNAQAAEALYEAERRGVKQIKGSTKDGAGGLCAVGVLAETLGGAAIWAIHDEHAKQPCPLCGQQPQRGGYFSPSLLFLIPHLNDDHGLTFGEIARKLGPDSA